MPHPSRRRSLPPFPPLAALVLALVLPGAGAAQICPRGSIADLAGVVVTYEDGLSTVIRARKDGLLVEDDLEDPVRGDGYRMILDQGVLLVGEMSFEGGRLDYDSFTSYGLIEPHPPLPLIGPNMAWAGTLLQITPDKEGREIAVATITGALSDTVLGGCIFRAIPVTLAEMDDSGTIIVSLLYLADIGITVMRRDVDVPHAGAPEPPFPYNVVSIRELEPGLRLPPVE